MSTKSSPPASSTTNTGTSASSITTTTTTGGSGGLVVKIKSELPTDEIKEYAENTMNELLGWYGFDGVDRLDLSTKNTRLLHQSSHSNNSFSHHQLERRRNRNRSATLLNLQQNAIRNINNNNNNNNSNSTSRHKNYNSSRNSSANSKSNAHKNNNIDNSSKSANTVFLGVGGGGGNESTTSDHDTRSSREDDSKSPNSAGRTAIDEKIDYENCCWCRRPVPENAPEFLTTSDGPRYCSESCFAQSRRASFKRAKTCDWCKHVRHAVSYVDFQDGASQLQFCSDKCLNQYKMQIFCKETQAHLDMNPHLRDQGLEAAVAGNGAGLITPDLWLRNCRSRSASPASTLSVSPGPATMATISAAISRPSPPLSSHANANDHKPLISVAPVSKLMSKSPSIMNSHRHSPKHSRKKRSTRSSLCATEVSISAAKSNHSNLRRELSNLASSGSANSLLTNTKSLLSVTKANNLRTSPGQTHTANSPSSSCSPSNKLPAPPTSLSQFAASSVQDLQMSMPPLSPMLEHPAPPPSLHQHPSSLSTHPSVGGRGSSTTIPPTFFATPSAGQSQQHATLPPPPHLASGFPRRPSFFQGGLPLGGGGGLPRLTANARLPYNMQQAAPPHALLPPDFGTYPSPVLGAPPPVTVMVPYPIIIPLPIPIPIPLPIIDFYKAHLTPDQRKRLKEEEQQESARMHETTQKIEVRAEETTCTPDSPNINISEEPLDFTKSKGPPVIVTQSLDDRSTTADANLTSLQPGEQQSCSVTEIITDNFISSSSSSTATVTVTAGTRKSTPNLENPESIEDSTNIAPVMPTPTSASPSPNILQEDADNFTSNDNGKEKLPKFKITRLHTKRTLIQTKESECSRPLRKRKRIIDCDFQKIAIANSKEGAAQCEEADPATASSTTATTCNSQTKNSTRKYST